MITYMYTCSLVPRPSPCACANITLTFDPRNLSGERAWATIAILLRFEYIERR